MPRSPGEMRPRGSTAVASAITAPAPPTARLPRCTRCQSPAKPSSLEYSHMGETAMRLRKVTPRMVSGEKRSGISLMIAIEGGLQAAKMKSAIHVDCLARGIVEQPIGDGADRACHIPGLAHARLRQQAAGDARGVCLFHGGSHVRANNARPNLEHLDAIGRQTLCIDGR